MVFVSDMDACAQLDVLKGAVCTIGVFDGVHEGHRFLIDECRRIAHEMDARCACITFDRDPDERFVSEFKKLMSNEQRIEALSDVGFDEVVVLSFTQAFSELSAEGFLDALFRCASPAAIVVAEDFRFGYRAQGDLQTLEDWGRLHHVRIVALELLESGDAPITSTRIRRLLEQGDVKGAERLLGHPLPVIPPWMDASLG